MQPTSKSSSDDGCQNYNAAVVFTIGHSSQSLESFVGLLAQHQVDVLADTRSNPSSQFAPQFNYDSLKESLPRTGINYVFFGKELGGRPKDQQFYDADGHVLYDRVARSSLFLGGITRLLQHISKWRVALLCSEENPAACHRRLLVGRVLAQRGFHIQHIRANGALQAEEALMAEEHERTVNTPQQKLFEFEQVPGWKSTQSVLRKKQRRNSLER